MNSVNYAYHRHAVKKKLGIHSNQLLLALFMLKTIFKEVARYAVML